MRILILNGGSSSIKSSLYDLHDGPLPSEPPQPVWEASADWSRDSGTAEIRARSTGSTHEKKIPIHSPAEVFKPLLESLWNGSTGLSARNQIDVVGHRVVHGGGLFRESTPLTNQVKTGIAQVAELAPAHNRLALHGMEAIEELLGPDVQQVAVFDTAFHSTLPAAAYVYPGPYDWIEQGIRRYGFHGISHSYVARRAPQILARQFSSIRLISCHLGNGCSLAAVKGGRCIDTTMGFTPLDGLMMGSRAGSIDPGILLHLLRHGGYTIERLDNALYKESGLKGVSGLSGDMREILAEKARGNSRAQLAFDIFVHRLYSGIGAMLASLGGLDALVFTAGIGENAAPVREAVCQRFDFISLALDPEKNTGSPVDADIAADGSAVRVLLVRTQEDWEIARECFRLASAR